MGVFGDLWGPGACNSAFEVVLSPRIEVDAIVTKDVRQLGKSVDSRTRRPEDSFVETTEWSMFKASVDLSVKASLDFSSVEQGEVSAQGPGCFRPGPGARGPRAAASGRGPVA